MSSTSTSLFPLLLTLSLSLLPSPALSQSTLPATPTTQSLPTSSSQLSSYPYSLANSLGMGKYATLPMPAGGTGNWSGITSGSTSTSTNTKMTTSVTKSGSSTTTGSTKTSTSSASSSTSTTTSTSSSSSIINSLTANYITSYWDLPKGAGHISFGSNNVAFTDDPSLYPSTMSNESQTVTGDSSQVLQIKYPSGSYSGGSGGAQWISTALADQLSPTSMLLTYSVYFPTGYNFVQGGKLPGLRGGSSLFGCSGGNESGVGSNCFSARLMWRPNGAGEVYAYIPTSSSLCAQSDVICDSLYGTSLGRGKFTFLTGQWNEIGLYVKLNSGTGTSDGVIQLYHNSNLAISFTNLQISSSTSLSSLTGLFFSTFFGGSDSSWATPTDQYSYFKDMMVWANGTKGEGVTSSGGGKSAAGRGVGLGSGLATGMGIVVGGVVALLLGVI